MIISTDAEKAFEKTWHPFIIEIIQKIGNKGTYLNIEKGIYDKPTAYVILNGEKIKAFPVRLGKRKVCPFLSLLFNIDLEVLATSISEVK